MIESTALIQALLSSFDKYKRELHGKRVWLACSGGRDSLSLALLCRQLFDSGQLPFLPQLLHVNHGIQKANSAWSQQVAIWAKEQNIPCKILHLALADKSEKSARQARYHAMMSVMNRADVLLLGHHQDDQVETVLMRLFNGTGVTGLGGMSAWTPKQRCSHSEVRPNQAEVNDHIYLWRPWLTISRAQITAYAKQSRLNYIDDPTNVITFDAPLSSMASGSFNVQHDADTENLALNVNDRAWLRSKLMPVIYERYPQANEAIARTSQLMQDASCVLNTQAKMDLDAVKIQKYSTLAIAELQSVIDITKLQQLVRARQSTLIHAWLSPTAQELPAPKRLVDDVLELCQRSDNDHQTRLYWDSGCYQYDIRRYQHKLYRLRTDWLQWLSLTPKSVKLEIANNHAYQQGTDMSKQALVIESLSLKPSHSTISWYLTSISSLVRALALGECSYQAKQVTQLCFEPMPRNLKLALAGREGRKSGKKLLQAINQPSFLRESIVLCSLQRSVGDDPTATNHIANTKTPLFLISLDDIYPLQSPFSEKITTWLKRHDLSVEVVYTTV